MKKAKSIIFIHDKQFVITYQKVLPAQLHFIEDMPIERCNFSYKTV